MTVAFRFLLSPLAPFWWLFAALKRWAHSAGIKKRYQSSLSTLVVGNLSMGGTGKTPFSIYLIEKLKSQEIEVAYLSRGYGRKTKGLLKVAVDSKVSTVGDEALMVKIRFPEIDVVVCENRKEGLQFLEKSSLCRVVVMDDAFQHLRIKAHHYFMLSTYQKPFYKDFIFPLGNLREPRRFAKVANTVVITKCPKDLRQAEKEHINEKQKRFSLKGCAFISIKYANQLYSVFGNNPINANQVEKVVAFSGIASAHTFLKKLEENFELLDSIEFSDHHVFTVDDFSQIEKKLSLAEKMCQKNIVEHKKSVEEKKVSELDVSLGSTKQNLVALITTEKDAARLQTPEAKKVFSALPLFYWPINLAPDAKINKEIDQLIKDKC